MFPSQNPVRVPIDQFTRLQANGHSRSPRWAQIVMVLPAVATAVGLFFTRPDLSGAVSGLLTATSIMTGFIFSMAVVFWNKSIDARRDPNWSIRGDILREIDETRTHLIYTVSIGILTVACLVLQALFGHAAAPTAVRVVIDALTPIAGSLVVYLLTLVSGALIRFNAAAIRLR